MDKYYEDIVIVYVDTIQFKSPAIKKKLKDRPKEGEVYRAFHVKGNLESYRIVFEDEGSVGKVSGLVTAGLAVDDDLLELKLIPINEDNLIDVEMGVEQAEKVARWLTSDNKDLDKYRYESLEKEFKDDTPIIKLLEALRDTPKVTTEEAIEPELYAGEESGFSFDGDVIKQEYWEALSVISEKDPDMMRAISDLMIYISGCYSDKYAASDIDTKSLFMGKTIGKGFNIGNTIKYLSRYVTDGYPKSNNPVDIQKAAHYLLFELMRVNSTKPTN